jgi:hypothetical protein
MSAAALGSDCPISRRLQSTIVHSWRYAEPSTPSVQLRSDELFNAGCDTLECSFAKAHLRVRNGYRPAVGRNRRE